jgi:hypothetical protein
MIGIYDIIYDKKRQRLVVCMSKKLQGIVDNIETIQRSFSEPTSILVSDTKQILVQLRASFDTINIPVGKKLETFQNLLLMESLKTGKY